MDAICSNEIDSNKTQFKGKDDLYSLELKCRMDDLFLKYDITPAQFITAIVSEIRLIPPTSVPVFIKEYNYT